MRKETIDKIKALRGEIWELDVEISRKEKEIYDMYSAEGEDYTGSYVEYFDGRDYIYMKVERQTLLPTYHGLTLYGPGIHLASCPFDEDDDGEIDFGSFYESESIVVTDMTLKNDGSTTQTFRRITEENMKDICDKYRNAIYKKML